MPRVDALKLTIFINQTLPFYSEHYYLIKFAEMNREVDEYKALLMKPASSFELPGTTQNRKEILQAKKKRIIGQIW